MCFSSPKMPAPVAPPPQAPTEQDPAVLASLDAERRRQAMKLGKPSTILTGPAGIAAPVNSAPKTLLGQ